MHLPYTNQQCCVTNHPKRICDLYPFPKVFLACILLIAKVKKEFPTYFWKSIDWEYALQNQLNRKPPNHGQKSTTQNF